MPSVEPIRSVLRGSTRAPSRGATGCIHYFINNQPVEVPPLHAQLASFLGISGRRPDLVVRFGYGPEIPRSLRRPVEEVLV